MWASVLLAVAAPTTFRASSHSFGGREISGVSIVGMCFSSRYVQALSREPRRAGILVGFRHVLVEFKADSRPIVQGDEAVPDDLAAIADRCPVIAVHPMELQHQEVR